jgi:hypothetical protein
MGPGGRHQQDFLEEPEVPEPFTFTAESEGIGNVGGDFGYRLDFTATRKIA